MIDALSARAEGISRSGIDPSLDPHPRQAEHGEDKSPGLSQDTQI